MNKNTFSIQIEEIISVEGFSWLVTELSDGYEHRFKTGDELVKWLMIHQPIIDQTNINA